MDPINKACPLIVLSFLLLFSSPAWTDVVGLVWSTFLGGGDEEGGMGISLDGSGYVYVTGTTESTDFPTTAGAFDTSYNGGWNDSFVLKLNPAGNALVYATFLGGSNNDWGYGIAVDSSGVAYLTGCTASDDFPTTAGAFDATHNGGADVFVARLNPAGSDLVYATFLGGGTSDYGYDIALDGSGGAYLTGYTESADFPATAGAFDTMHNSLRDVFVAKLNATGNALDYCTFLGGDNAEDGWSIAVDEPGNAYVTGVTWSDDFPTTTGAFDTSYNYRDVFVAKLNAVGSALAYCTFLGESDWDDGRGISVDDSGYAYVTGGTRSANFPTTARAFDETQNGGYDVFVVKLNRMGSALIYSTFLGGNNWDEGHGIAVDGSGKTYVTGKTFSPNFPTTAGAFDGTHNGNYDVFVAKLNSTGNALDYSTFLGGDLWDYGGDIAVNGAGYSYVTGETESSDFPTTAGAYDTTYNGGEWFAAGDVFVAKLSLNGTPVVSETGVVGLPEDYALHQNYPNPFNASTEIRYRIPEDGHVTIKIFNTLGQEVRTLVNADRQVGEYIVTWDGRDDEGHEAASGLYFCRLRAGDFAKTIKMVLVR